MSRRIGRDRKRWLCPQCGTGRKLDGKSRCRACWNANTALYDYWRRLNASVIYSKPTYNLAYETRRAEASVA